MAEDWTSLTSTHNLAKFAAELPTILKDADHNEMYGVELVAPNDGQSTAHTTLIILAKFLRANADDLSKAKEQLSAALKWRKMYRPREALGETFSTAKFGKLGYVTSIKGAKETCNNEDVVTFNIYGAAAKDPKKTFGDTDAFIRWRVALMELTLQQLRLSEATKPIPDYGNGPDPYQAVQVHDYLSVSFFRQPAEVRASSSKIIDLFQRYYPETVSYKYFVNVPLVMQWMMGAMKALMSKDTIQKMTWMTYGASLSQYLGDGVPEEYGGCGPPLVGSAVTVEYDAGAPNKGVHIEADGQTIAEAPKS
ncbi:Non-classical phosphatidylinositol transfer protein (PITP) [Teratosphaeriaceae sp. CCFEE 6253]|nr:Non-classical phosphatidylinositol transfer protein (PITP) [Teratosphaeriaceae sp. CCFEE 6253]